MAANYYLKNLNEAKKVEAILNKKIKEQNGSEMDEFIEMLSWVPVTFNNPKEGGTYTVQMKDGSIISAECTGSASTSFYENDDTKSNFCYTFFDFICFLHKHNKVFWYQSNESLSSDEILNLYYKNFIWFIETYEEELSCIYIFEDKCRPMYFLKNPIQGPISSKKEQSHE